MARSRKKLHTHTFEYDDGLKVTVQGVDPTILQGSLKREKVKPPLGKDGRPNRFDETYKAEREYSVMEPMLRMVQTRVLFGIKSVEIPPVPLVEKEVTEEVDGVETTTVIQVPSDEEWYAELDSREFLEEAKSANFDTNTEAERRMVWCYLYLSTEDIGEIAAKIEELSERISEKK